MKKYIVLILGVMVTFVDSNEGQLEAGSIKRNFSGIVAFIWAYRNITTRVLAGLDNETLNNYIRELFTSATKGFQDTDILSPAQWCIGKYAYVSVMSQETELSSFEALSRSYYKTSFNTVSGKNDTKLIRNPVEYCSNLPPNRIPSDYAGYYVVFGFTNQQMNIQDRGRNQNAGEGSSRIHSDNIVNDNEGREIDLNKPYDYQEDVDNNQI